jgi:hypothetical protein
LSYYINGVESPTIVVNRGDVLTFTIIPAEHPFYLTSSKLGGRLSNLASGETILAGDLGVAVGSEGTPYVLTWTVPDDFTLAYYQCYDHQKLGWEIVAASTLESGSFKIEGASTISLMAAMMLLLL